MAITARPIDVRTEMRRSIGVPPLSKIRADLPRRGWLPCHRRPRRLRGAAAMFRSARISATALAADGVNDRLIVFSHCACPAFPVPAEVSNQSVVQIMAIHHFRKRGGDQAYLAPWRRNAIAFRLQFQSGCARQPPSRRHLSLSLLPACGQTPQTRPRFPLCAQP
jgi:hypothetical protein